MPETLRIYEIINIISLLLIFIFSIKKSPINILFKAILIFAVCFETIGIKAYKTWIGGSNRYYYDLFALSMAVLYQCIFMIGLPEFSAKKLIKYILTIWNILALIYILSSQSKGSHSQIYTFSMVLVFGLAIYYLYSKIFIEPFQNIFRLPLVWFSFGILVFFSSNFPILAWLNIFFEDDNLRASLKPLLQFGNIFLSLGYLSTVICLIRTRSS